MCKFMKVIDMNTGHAIPNIVWANDQEKMYCVEIKKDNKEYIKEIRYGDIKTIYDDEDKTKLTHGELELCYKWFKNTNTTFCNSEDYILCAKNH